MDSVTGVISEAPQKNPGPLIEASNYESDSRQRFGVILCRVFLKNKSNT